MNIAGHRLQRSPFGAQMFPLDDTMFSHRRAGRGRRCRVPASHPLAISSWLDARKPTSTLPVVCSMSSQQPPMPAWGV